MPKTILELLEKPKEQTNNQTDLNLQENPLNCSYSEFFAQAKNSAAAPNSIVTPSSPPIETVTTNYEAHDAEFNETVKLNSEANSVATENALKLANDIGKNVHDQLTAQSLIYQAALESMTEIADHFKESLAENNVKMKNLEAELTETKTKQRTKFKGIRTSSNRNEKCSRKIK